MNQAFRVGNWFNLRDLPNYIAPNNILQQLQQNMNNAAAHSSIQSLNNKHHVENLGKNGGYFEKFEYAADGYDQMKEINRQERI